MVSGLSNTTTLGDATHMFSMLESGFIVPPIEKKVDVSGRGIFLTPHV
jgi:hypothetical protein